MLPLHICARKRVQPAWVGFPQLAPGQVKINIKSQAEWIRPDRVRLRAVRPIESLLANLAVHRVQDTADVVALRLCLQLRDPFPLLCVADAPGTNTVIDLDGCRDIGIVRAEMISTGGLRDLEHSSGRKALLRDLKQGIQRHIPGRHCARNHAEGHRIAPHPDLR